MVGMYIIIPIVTFIIGGLLAWLGMRFLLKSKYDSVLQEAEKEAEVIKKNKMLEVKEKFLHLKADLEKQVSQRNAKIQSVETKLKQRELTMNQRQEELQRRNNEVEAVKENLSSQLELVEKKKQDLDKLHQKEVEHLEAISGLSAEEAKERLIESLKDEAKTQAASYINEIVEEAKMTANKEAKKIVIQSIQRVATETAIENSITVFHIESDEIKGRIIGREGRNIRALEAATGIEIVVDDTPEAIVLSGFDPVRREIARLALHQLVQDGRIHPARIEEVVTKVKKQVEDEVVETGKRTVIDLGVHGLHPELIRMIGKMKYRSSYGQNLLQHARETANLCAVMASELGLNPKKAKRAGLLHDIGKVPDDEPELPHAMRERLQKEMDLSEADTQQLTSSRELAVYFETTANAVKDKKAAVNWIRGEVLSQLNATETDISECPVSALQLAAIINKMTDGTINQKGARTIFTAIWEKKGDDIDALIESLGLKQISDTSAIEAIVDNVLAANEKMVQEYRSGKEKAFNALVGQTMRATKGKANPAQVNAILKKKLQA